MVNKDWRQREGATTTLTVAGNVLVSGTHGEDYTVTTFTPENNSGNSLITDFVTGEPLRSIKTGNYGSFPPKASSS